MQFNEPMMITWICLFGQITLNMEIGENDTEWDKITPTYIVIYNTIG